MSEPFMEIDHDIWNYGQPKLRSVGKITLPDVHGVLPFTGARNPTTISSTSHKVSLTYKTEANGWQPRIGLAESGAEVAVGEMALTTPGIYNVEFQPVRFPYRHPSGRSAWHTIDLRITFRSGLRRFIFVRNRDSLEKPWVREEIDAIAEAVPHHEAHEFAVVDGDSYSRPHRENLRRMHWLVAFEPDPASDRLVEAAIHDLKTLWRMSDLIPHLDLSPSRIFHSCMRLIAAKKLGANRDAVICHRSRIWRVEE
ncbi:hypothetical protein SAMN04488021_1645 [Paracoccus aminovorans]|uniref:TnsA endonuclease N terminal n=1 Tax=Paracoccus aminovorans TaxID=34004 RepID=A0A1I3F846_9RHOB|nr:hypothetical protein [Paracoccus aminovorans]CQR87340.1 hypothetical protein JCM7685_2797 [Paracoccus aminovorans]SFI07394.1 hypothetical protein SAMN04488021_1645 [Paracoccus aminovorans]